MKKSKINFIFNYILIKRKYRFHSSIQNKETHQTHDSIMDFTNTLTRRSVHHCKIGSGKKTIPRCYLSVFVRRPGIIFVLWIPRPIIRSWCEIRSNKSFPFRLTARIVLIGVWGGLKLLENWDRGEFNSLMISWILFLFIIIIFGLWQVPFFSVREQFRNCSILVPSSGVLLLLVFLDSLLRRDALLLRTLGLGSLLEFNELIWCGVMGQQW